MEKLKLIAVLAVAGLAGAVAWQVTACELANMELQSDLQDLAAQAGMRIGLNGPKTDEDLREAVIGKAKELGIALEPGQVSVQHTGGDNAALQLAADYTAHVNLRVYSFELHFNPSSGK